MFRLEHENYSAPEASLGFRVQIRSRYWQHALQFRANYVLKLLYLSKSGIMQLWKLEQKNGKSSVCRDQRRRSCAVLRGEETLSSFSPCELECLPTSLSKCHGGVWIFRSRSEKHTSSSLLLCTSRYQFSKRLTVMQEFEKKKKLSCLYLICICIISYILSCPCFRNIHEYSGQAYTHGL